ncbi:unnamed protein product [Brassica rapa]|uniref:Uncharacterized protein n=3 Tax=Brassica TaxID=3705 RepID=A0A8D9HCF6_BRACM|nr:unnamed protein product [Brassica napus]CAG7897134.1 unnamed protein product [Brassica rapa]
MLELPHLIIMVAIYAITNRKPQRIQLTPSRAHVCRYGPLGRRLASAAGWLYAVLKTRVLVTLSLQLALLEVAWHLCCLRLMVSFPRCPSISMVQVASRKVCYIFLIIESRASWSVKYKFEDIINT